MSTKTCFVIMPFSKTESCSQQIWTKIYEEMVKPAVTGSKLSFTCERAKPRTGNLIRDILNKLNSADVVIADLTDMNPNVFYELGVRHTLRNRTVLITQDMQHVPSDLQSYWVVVYKRGQVGRADFKQNIREILREMITAPDKPDSPVADFLTETNRKLLSQEKSDTSKKLTALCSELSHNINTTERLLGKVPKWLERIKQKKKLPLPVIRFDDSCLGLLLSTYYIALPERILNRLRLVRVAISISNRRLDLMSQEGYYESAVAKLVDVFPTIKKHLTELLKEISKIRIDFLNDNYQEPEVPAVILADASHKKYFLST
ncbi:MAG: hypothetical protein H8E40_06085 [Chloroflexi bacterium]|nr:hypothetical protein [Chloroflexota bacterium]